MFIKKDQTIKQVVPGARGGPGEMIRHDWTPDLPPHVTMLTTIVLEPGSGIGYHTHDTNTEMIYILEGELEVVDNGQAYTAVPGDMMITGGGQGHSVTNHSSNPVSMVAVTVSD